MAKDVKSGAPTPRVPHALAQSSTSGFRLRHVQDVAPLYLEDVHVIHQAMVQVCASVTMESAELLGITLDNLGDIKLERLTQFKFHGTNPNVTVDLGSNDYCSVSATGEFKVIDPVVHQLVHLLKSRRKPVVRFTRIPMIMLLLLLTGVSLLALIILKNLVVADAPMVVDTLTWVTTVLLVSTLLLLMLSRPSAVVYPIWRRDAKAVHAINWRFQFVDLLKMAIVAVIGFLLGKYFS